MVRAALPRGGTTGLVIRGVEQKGTTKQITAELHLATAYSSIRSRNDIARAFDVGAQKINGNATSRGTGSY